jgi:hypothetical protein
LRDRGITQPALKAGIALAAALAGAAALAWSFVDDAPAAARTLGATALVLGILAALNYLYAQSLVRRARRGEDLIARWRVSPSTLARFEQAERARKRGKNNWGGWRKHRPHGLEVIFVKEAVVVGDTYFTLRKVGTSRITHVHIERGAVDYIQFATTLTVTGAGHPQTGKIRYRGHLRIPVADNATIEAARVVAHFSNPHPGG